MKCYCGKEALKGYKYCRTHYIEENENIFLDNSDGNYGIIKWAKYMLPEFMINDTPQFHYQILDKLFMLFDPFYKNRYERQLNVISFRGSSKSTLINTIFLMYIITHNNMDMYINGINGDKIKVKIQKKNIVIASETGSSAEDFVVRIRDEIRSNANLKYFYQFAIENAVDDETGQWTRRAFKINGCYVIGIGQGMQIRGKVKGASRPDLVIFDDIYSENNVQTEEGRLKVSKWFSRATANTIDDLRGMMIFVGTIVHEDTVLVQNKKSENWKTIEIPVMDVVEFKNIIEKYLTVDLNMGKCTLPFSNIENEIERKNKQREFFYNIQEKEVTTLAWKERIDLYFLVLKYQEDLSRGTLNGFYQEYFHIVVDETQKRIKSSYFKYIKDWEVIYEYGYNWLVYRNEDKEVRECVNIEFGIDMGSGSIDGDDTAIAIVAKDSKEMIYVLNISYGKFGLIDTDKTGAIDETLRLCKIYHPSKIKIGYSGNEKTFLNVFRKYFLENNIYISILGRTQTGDKFERIWNTLTHLYESRRIYHTEGMTKLEAQLEFLSTMKHDDLADSLEVAVQGLQAGSNIDVSIFNSTKKRIPFSKYRIPIDAGYGSDDKWLQN